MKKIAETKNSIRLFLCGDVMTGRGIDQILPYPSDPTLYEPQMKSALEYVKIAELVNGPVPRGVDFPYIWGEALEELERVRPDVRMANLETSITTSTDPWRGKGINYRMNPANIGCLTAAGIDACALANNHVLDWGYPGLLETLEVHDNAGILYAGAGRNLEEARRPASLPVSGKGRVLLFSAGSETSGIPGAWAAGEEKSGVNLLEDLSPKTLKRIGNQVVSMKKPGDIVVFSIHWGGNWGYRIPREETAFARGLIDSAGVDVVWGHSSHHVKGIEIYKGKPILYGCGDFLNDYEGIDGFEAFRGDLGLMYFLSFAPEDGMLTRFQVTPTRTRRFRVERAGAAEAEWLQRVLTREGKQLGTGAELLEDGRMELRW